MNKKHWSELVLAVMDADTCDLRELALLGNGDPAQFYKGINLDGVDLSGQDLRGMEFTTLDRGAILVDNDTMLDEQYHSVHQNLLRKRAINLVRIKRRRDGVKASDRNKSDVKLIQTHGDVRKRFKSIGIKNPLWLNIISSSEGIITLERLYLIYNLSSILDTFEMRDLFYAATRELDYREGEKLNRVFASKDDYVSMYLFLWICEHGSAAIDGFPKKIKHGSVSQDQVKRVLNILESIGGVKVVQGNDDVVDGRLVYIAPDFGSLLNVWIEEGML